MPYSRRLSTLALNNLTAAGTKLLSLQLVYLIVVLVAFSACIIISQVYYFQAMKD